MWVESWYGRPRNVRGALGALLNTFSTFILKRKESNYCWAKPNDIGGLETKLSEITVLA